MELKVYDEIKLKLKILGKTQSELSRSIGKNYNVMNRYLNGLAPMPEKVLGLINSKIEEWDV